MKKFKPDKELLQFATYFSDNYKKLSAGQYVSDDGRYSIKYLNRFKDGLGRRVKSFLRISNKTGIAELDRIEFIKNKKLTKNFVFYGIMWCFAIKSIKGEDSYDAKLIIADTMANRYYCSTGRPPKDVAIGWLVLFKCNPSALSEERYSKTINQIEKSNKKK